MTDDPKSGRVDQSGNYSVESFLNGISLGARAVGWLDSDVDEFIAERVKASRKPV